MITKKIILFIAICCCMGAGWCQPKQIIPPQIIPQQVIVYSGHASYYGYYSHYYAPVVTQNIRYYPYIENRLEYKPIMYYNTYVMPHYNYQDSYIYPYYFNY